MKLNQIQPFNEHRFDACINYMSRRYGRFMDQYDISKLHVLIDFYHILETGRPMIGGALERWPWGPVVKHGYNRISWLGHEFDEVGRQVHRGHIRVVGKAKKAYSYTAYGEVDDEDFSPVEVASMKRAWDFLMSMDFGERCDFFHGPHTFIGRVWERAGSKGAPISWLDLVDEYDREHNEDHRLAKTVIRMWQE